MISRAKWPRTQLVSALIVLMGIFYVATIREGHDWGGDFSAYIQHASNLVEGRPYTSTSYVYTSHGLGPRAYPPAFPWLLTPVYAIRGLDLEVMKVEVVLFFLLFLVVLGRGVGSGLSRRHRAVLVALVGFAPSFCYLKDQVLPTFPFLFFVFASLSILRARGPREADNWWLPRSILAGVLTYLAFATRTVGFVLLPALVARDFLTERFLTAGGEPRTRC